MKLLRNGFLLIAAFLSVNAFALDFDSNMPGATKDQLLGDLTFIGSLVGGPASPLHNEVFGAVDGPAYHNWFHSRIKRVGYDANGPGGAVAYVQPFFDSEKMFLTQNYVNFSHPQIARLMIFFHEARHTENGRGNWRHARCPSPFLDKNGDEVKSIWTGFPLAGQDGCDSVATGSYGLTVVMNKNVAKLCSNCTEKVKMDAGIYADDQFKRVTNAQASRQLLSDLYDQTE